LGVLVAAVSACGENPNELHECTPAECGIPATLAPLMYSMKPIDNGITLTVELNGPALEIRFYRSVGLGQWLYLGTVAVDAPDCCTFTDVGLEPGKSYRYYATAIRFDGTETPSAWTAYGRAGPIPPTGTFKTRSAPLLP
jgi:hypothetical protein